GDGRGVAPGHRHRAMARAEPAALRAPGAPPPRPGVGVRLLRLRPAPARHWHAAGPGRHRGAVLLPHQPGPGHPRPQPEPAGHRADGHQRRAAVPVHLGGRRHPRRARRDPLRPAGQRLRRRVRHPFGVDPRLHRRRARRDDQPARRVRRRCRGRCGREHDGQLSRLRTHPRSAVGHGLRPPRDRADRAAPGAARFPLGRRRGGGAFAVRSPAVAWLTRGAFVGGLAALVLLFPLTRSGIEVNVYTEAVIYAIIGLSLNVLVGYAGQISLGHQAFVGIGAFTSAYMTTVHEQNFVAAIGVTMLVGAAQALLLGLVSLRITGLYFALVTLTYGTMAENSLFNITSLTGGSAGQAAPKP